DKPPGTIVDVQKNGIYVQTGRDILKIGELQLEGGRRISCSDFIVGHKIERLIKLGMDTGRKND
ncbi:MAG TPA: methionyl-tRNA formyltransferase, partial [bacterium]